MNLIDSEIFNFYNKGFEDSRLTVGLGPLEFERNKDLISRYLPNGVATIVDIGGGTGHYASWLSSLGHDVTLIDPVDKHVQLARKRAKKSKASFNVVLGEAQHLSVESRSADLVILHGPLYHLQDEGERLAAIREASRILKPDGVVLGFAITHAASTLAALHSGLIHDSFIYTMCQQELKSGEHYPSEGLPGMLPRAYFHRPADLIREFSQAGLLMQALLAVEGMIWMDGNYFESWSNPQKKRRLLDLVKLTESDRDLLSMSPHIVLVAGKDLG